MNFGPSNAAPPTQVKLPDLRRFTVVRYRAFGGDSTADEREEITVFAHAYVIEECGALSFVSYTLYENNVIPQKSRSCASFIDVWEETDFVPQRVVTH